MRWRGRDGERPETSAQLLQPHGRSFVFAEPVPLEPHHFNKDHLFAGTASEILCNARSAYLKALPWSGFGPHFWLIIRHLGIDYVSEAFAGEELWVGVQTVARTAKTVHLDLCVWEAPSARLILEGTLADVAFDVLRRRSVELPDDLWAAIEAYEGRALPVRATGE